MDTGEQAETIRFLERALGEGPSVEILTTHASMIFLTADRAYKLKRAVRLPYLDYSTPQKRQAACLAEFDLNRRTAPDLYVDVRTIRRGADGRLAFDGSGSLVDAVVVMHRFDDACLFDRMAQQGTLTAAVTADLAQRIADFHRAAPVRRDLGGAAGIACVLDINERSLLAAELVPDGAVADFSAKFRRAFDRHTEEMESRRLSGKVRRCHGDLTLRNICLLHKVPTLFDCIEFDENLATIDVLYDLAFLLMDLWHRDQRQLANILLNRYLDQVDETDGLALVPFFMAIRAAVRAHVTATQAGQTSGPGAESLRGEAREYFDLAEALLQGGQRVLVGIGGFSGSGKSTVASLVAPELGPAPGARVLNSDRVRKRIHAVPVDVRLPASAYGPNISEHVYATLRQEAARALRAGSAVIVDAVFDRAEERGSLRQLAGACRVPFAGYWLYATEDILVSRVAARRNDPSDATADIVHRQLGHDCGPIDWTCIDASRDPAVVKDGILREQGVA